MKSVNVHKQNKLLDYFKDSRPKKSLIIAHRGAKSLAKIENTLESFQIAIDLNVRMIEFDVRRLRDGTLIIFHDEQINNRMLNTFTYHDLCKLTLADDYLPPRLEEALALCSGNIFLDIELKEPGYEKEVLDLVSNYFSENEYIITSFHDSVIAKVKEVNRSIKAGLLIGLKGASIKQRLSEFFPIKRLKQSGADFVVPHYLLVTPMLVRACRVHRYAIFVWTVNKKNHFKRLAKHRVAAIITDFPQKYSY